MATTLVVRVGCEFDFVRPILLLIPKRATKRFGAIIWPVAAEVMSVTSPPRLRALM
jgi:hypothetical protein